MTNRERLEKASECEFELSNIELASNMAKSLSCFCIACPVFIANNSCRLIKIGDSPTNKDCEKIIYQWLGEVVEDND